MIERFATVKVTKLLEVKDKTFPECFIKSRRLNMEGTVDSAMYMNYNHYWLVKHITSTMVRGISIGYYGIYHEDELEVMEAPPQRTTESYERSETVAYADDDDGFTYSSWDDVPE